MLYTLLYLFENQMSAPKEPLRWRLLPCELEPAEPAAAANDADCDVIEAERCDCVIELARSTSV